MHALDLPSHTGIPQGVVEIMRMHDIAVHPKGNHILSNAERNGIRNHRNSSWAPLADEDDVILFGVTSEPIVVDFL